MKARAVIPRMARRQVGWVRTTGNTQSRLNATAFAPRIEREGCNDKGVVWVEDQTNSAIGVGNTRGSGRRTDQDTLEVFVSLKRTCYLVVGADLVEIL